MNGVKDPPDPLGDDVPDWSSDTGDTNGSVNTGVVAIFTAPPTQNEDSTQLPGTSNPTVFNVLQNTAQGKQNSSKFESFTYTHKDSGPYRVYLELRNRDDGRKINKFSVGQMLRQKSEFRNHVTDMKYIGKYKILVYVNSYGKANHLVKMINDSSNQYKAYVPRHLVTINGVIAGIPTDITDEEIMNEIECEVPVLSVKRLTRTAERIPTTRISVTFRASQLPDYVRVFYCSSRVRPFYQKLVMCAKCLRFNHREANCRGSKRCSVCTEQHETTEEFENCKRNVRCASCKSTEHKTGDAKCKERVRHEKIKGLMARKNVTFTEAQEMYPVTTENLYEPLNNIEEFPTTDESYARMTGGSFKWKNPLREEWIKTNHERKEIRAAIEIEKEKREKERAKGLNSKRRPESAENGIMSKAQRTTMERNQIVQQEPSNAAGLTGTALVNNQAVNEKEKWETMIQQAAEEKARAIIKSADNQRQAMMMNFYADFVTQLGNNDVAKAKFNECTNKYFNLAKTIIQQSTQK